MNTNLRTLLSICLLSCYSFTFVGCNGPAATTDDSTVTDSDHDHDHGDHDHDHDHDDGDHDEHDHGDHDEHDHGDHDEHAEHDDHAGHDHPAHGPNGGHMVELSGGAHAEWVHDDDKDLLTVHVENPSDVTKVEMKTTISDNETAYEFEKKEADGKVTFQLVSPELLTSIKMGDVVKAQLIITTADGEVTGKVQHHSH